MSFVFLPWINLKCTQNAIKTEFSNMILIVIFIYRDRCIGIFLKSKFLHLRLPATNSKPHTCKTASKPLKVSLQNIYLTYSLALLYKAFNMFILNQYVFFLSFFLSGSFSKHVQIVPGTHF